MNSEITRTIGERNKNKQLALSIFLTAGFPDKDNFTDNALKILDAGADMLEIGIPFSDPIADGPVIQKSSQMALKNGIKIRDIFNMASAIKAVNSKPLILMGYANPLIQYGLQQFLTDSANSGIDGLIIPDIPLDEDQEFWQTYNRPDRILLTTPTSPIERMQEIDKQSEGFVYCVSVTGTTGAQGGFDEAVLTNLAQTYNEIKKNKMLTGFGISNREIIRQLKNHCDGVIVGSAIIKKMLDTPQNIVNILDFVLELRAACDE